jgi:hypothetical protein
MNRAGWLMSGSTCAFRRFPRGRRSGHCGRASRRAGRRCEVAPLPRASRGASRPPPRSAHFAPASAARQPCRPRSPSPSRGGSRWGSGRGVRGRHSRARTSACRIAIPQCAPLLCIGSGFMGFGGEDGIRTRQADTHDPLEKQPDCVPLPSSESPGSRPLADTSEPPASAPRTEPLTLAVLRAKLDAAIVAEAWEAVKTIRERIVQAERSAAGNVVDMGARRRAGER